VENVLVLATSNPGKVAEIKELLKDLPVRVRPFRELVGGLGDDLLEPGSTFAENALAKAALAARRTGCLALADDSGLVVTALHGRPGIHSARFAGPDAQDADNVRLLLEEMRGLSERSAYFHCHLALADPSGVVWLAQGQVYGEILTAPRGKGGFGYDPVFFYPPAGLSFAEMDRAAKSAVSHRGVALQELRKLVGEALRAGWRLPAAQLHARPKSASNESWRVGVLSDTHRDNAALQAAMHGLGETDLVLHAGDYWEDVQGLTAFGVNRVVAVIGNCDGDIPGLRKELLQLADWRILLVHGHQVGVKNGWSGLKQLAKLHNAQIVVFGHTHIPLAFQEDGILFLNPGSPALPRGGSQPGCAVLNIAPHHATARLITLHN
jgi:XTP/dITP diphosphohydrolase